VLLEVGRIGRPHGVHGAVLVTLITTERSRLEPGSVLFAGQRRLVVAASRPHGDRWIVAFEGVTTRSDAGTLVGELLRAEAPAVDDDPDALWVHELIGAEVVDREGRSCGRVSAVVANPASDLIELDGGALVPLTFVVGWIDRPRTLRIDPPPGLFD